MGQVVCKACWTRYDTEALACPQCKRPNPDPRRKAIHVNWTLWAPVAAVMAVVVLYVLLAPLIGRAA